MNTPNATPDDTPLMIPEDILKQMERSHDAFTEVLPSLPLHRPCEKHPQQMTTLDIVRSWKNKEAVYPGCLECAAATRRYIALRDGVPPDVLHATLENFQVDRPAVKPGFHTPRDFLDAALQLASGKARNGVFCGPPGIGKGHLAGALAMRSLDAGLKVAWIDCARLFRYYHEAYSDGTTESLVDHYREPDLLILDEVCLRELPRDGEEILFAILAGRQLDTRRTLLLSNKPGPAIKEWIGERIYDRLKSGTCLYCYGEWESMRGTAQDGAHSGF